MIDESTIREALRQIVDPELDCNIVDLGLVYGIAVMGSKITVKIHTLVSNTMEPARTHVS